MVKSGYSRRLLWLASLVGLIFLGLGTRLAFLQVVWHDKYRKIAEGNTQSFAVREPRRGDILDANGNPLATTFPVKRVFANPAFLGTHYAEVAHLLAPLLKYSESELAQKMYPFTTNQAGQVRTNLYANLRRKVTVEEWSQITQAMAQISFNIDESKLPRAQKRFYKTLRTKGIYAVDDNQRIYPSKTLAAHVVGFVQEIDREFNNTAYTEIEGRDGIELSLDSQLRGVRGWRMTETDNHKQEIVIHREQEVEARPGLNAVLSVDLVIQSFVEQQLAEAMKKHSPLSASSMVVRPATGEILAMATLPCYDPNQPSSYTPEMRNRIITDTAEPGSTFKIVVISSALSDNLVTLNDTFDCEMGRFLFMGKILRDHEKYPVISVEEILAKSSNIGAAKIGLKLGEDRLYDSIRAFGFGNRTDIPLSGEVRGIVHPVKAWSKLDISRIPMGQAVAVTQLQMMMAMCAIANGGKLMRPMLVNRLQDQNGHVFAQYHPQMVRQVISEHASHETIQALKRVVSKDGTAAKAKLEHYSVAGKTGTAQKAGGGHYLEGKYYSSFIGFFPADNPEVCISVVLDEPKNGHFGGQIAAPFFREIAEQVAKYLKVKPDELPNDVMAVAPANARITTAAAANR